MGSVPPSGPVSTVARSAKSRRWRGRSTAAPPGSPGCAPISPPTAPRYWLLCSTKSAVSSRSIRCSIGRANARANSCAPTTCHAMRSMSAAFSRSVARPAPAPLWRVSRSVPGAGGGSNRRKRNAVCMSATTPARRAPTRRNNNPPESCNGQIMDAVSATIDRDDNLAVHPDMSDAAAPSHLDHLEAESIHIIREAVAESENPVLLYSIGKDSSVLLHLVRKAFYPAQAPLPLLHVDTTWKFREMIAFRDARVKELGLELIVHVNHEGLERGIDPIASGCR